MIEAKDNTAKDNIYTEDDPLITETGGSFRDSVSNIDDSGNRVWVYPSKPKGILHRWRLVVGYFSLALFFIMPFIKYDGKPFLLIDLINRQFILFGSAFWPQDFFILALAFLALAIFIILFTAIYGRLWCGWLCPQTIFMELVFRKIEYFIEGDAPKQKKLDESDLTVGKILKKTTKHLIFFAISLVSISFLTSYVVGIDTVQQVMKSPAEFPAGFAAIIILALVFDFVFAKFREQACIFVCPYARLQSVLIDKNSLVVAYDNSRGEPTGRRGKNTESSDLGDCIDCGMCVRVCPTGIDIRNGIQLECVNCAACIDSCNSIMEKVNKPKKLIRYASLNQIENKTKFRISPRIILYSVALTLLIIGVSYLLGVRSDVEATVLRAKGTIYILNDNGTISNLYTAKIANKTFKKMKLELKVEDMPASVIRVVGQRVLDIEPDKLIETAFFIELPKSAVTVPNTKLKVGVYSSGRRIYTVNTSFSGPESKR